MNIKELRQQVGMTQQAFSEYFGFSKRAVESWEGGKRECPDYLIRLIAFKLEADGFFKKKNDVVQRVQPATE